MFTDYRLRQLDLKVNKINPAWPVITPKGDLLAAAKTTKIHITSEQSTISEDTETGTNTSEEATEASTTTGLV